MTASRILVPLIILRPASRLLYHVTNFDQSQQTSRPADWMQFSIHRQYEVI